MNGTFYRQKKGTDLKRPCKVYKKGGQLLIYILPNLYFTRVTTGLTFDIKKDGFSFFLFDMLQSRED